jgi:predicted small secreted protein
MPRATRLIPVLLTTVAVGVSACGSDNTSGGGG